MAVTTSADDPLPVLQSPGRGEVRAVGRGHFCGDLKSGFPGVAQCLNPDQRKTRGVLASSTVFLTGAPSSKRKLGSAK